MLKIHGERLQQGWRRQSYDRTRPQKIMEGSPHLRKRWKKHIHHQVRVPQVIY
jgi:hypothetical protein